MKAGLPLLALTLTLAACAPAAKAPPRPVASASAPRPPVTTTLARPAPLPAVPETGWMDAPLTPGEWRYENRGNWTAAAFSGQASFTISCLRSSAQIRLGMPGPGGGAATIRTETATRTLPLIDGGGEIPTAHANLAATDPLLDAMALSKGRFAVEATGRAPLYVPSYAEVSRVIEDCR